MWPVSVGVYPNTHRWVWVWPVRVGVEEEVGVACEGWGRGIGGCGL